MTDIKKLIHRYYTPDGKNMTGYNKKNHRERYTGTYAKNEYLEKNLRYRHGILQDLLKESPFTLTTQQTTEIKYWIDTFNNEFKTFHRQSSNETIILAFIIIQAMKTNPKIRIEDYRICTKYHLNKDKYTLIQNRLIFQLMKTTPLVYNQARYVNHTLIEKGRRK